MRLFNAVAKAQRAQREAAGGGAKARVARLSKSSFLAELRRAAPGAAVRPCRAFGFWVEVKVPARQGRRGAPL